MSNVTIRPKFANDALTSASTAVLTLYPKNPSFRSRRFRVAWFELRNLTVDRDLVRSPRCGSKHTSRCGVEQSAIAAMPTANLASVMAANNPGASLFDPLAARRSAFRIIAKFFFKKINKGEASSLALTRLPSRAAPSKVRRKTWFPSFRQA